MSALCHECGARITQQAEKAIGDGEVQTVWADQSGNWVCTVTGDEHVPGTPPEAQPKRPVTVTVQHGETSTMIRLSLAEYGNFIADPILSALDDGDASWDLQEDDLSRHTTLFTWASGLYGVTRD